jgi:hypothetical protein
VNVNPMKNAVLWHDEHALLSLVGELLDTLFPAACVVSIVLWFGLWPDSDVAVKAPTRMTRCLTMPRSGRARIVPVVWA